VGVWGGDFEGEKGRKIKENTRGGGGGVGGGGGGRREIHTGF